MSGGGGGVRCSRGLARGRRCGRRRDQAQEAAAQIVEGILLADVKVSVYRIMLGWFVATLFALPVGILMGNFKFFEGLLEQVRQELLPLRW